MGVSIRRCCGSASLAAAPAPSIAIERIYPPPKRKETQLIKGTPAEADTRLAETLKYEVRVI